MARATGDGEVPEPRAAGAAGPLPEPRVPEISALLADLDELRLVLAADLGLAASAVEAGALDIAADMVAGGQDDLRHYSGRALGHLLPEEAAPQAPALSLVPSDGGAQADEADEAPVQAPRRSRRRLLPLAPALAAAAARVGVLAGVVPNGTTAAPSSSPTAAAAATYAELWRLHERGAPAPALRAAALELHEHVERLVQVAPQDAAAAEEALRLLELEAAVLDRSQHRAELLDALAETQRLVAALRAAVQGLAPDALRTPVRPLPLAPRPAASRPAVRSVPLVTRTETTPEPSPRPAGQPRTTAEAEPSAAPAQTAPQAEPTPAPEDEPPAQEPRPLFPSAGTQLGFSGL